MTIQFSEPRQKAQETALARAVRSAGAVRALRNPCYTPNPAIKHFWLRKLPPLQGQLVPQAQCMHCETPATPRATGEGAKTQSTNARASVT